MRIAFVIIFALFGVAPAHPQEQPDLLRKFQDVVSRFIPPQQPTEQPLLEGADPLAAENSPEAERQALWVSATKLTSNMAPGADGSPGPVDTPTSPHPKDECLDPTNFQTGQVGYLDYYLFNIVEVRSNEVYLKEEGKDEPFCLTGVATEELEPEDPGADTFGAEESDMEDFAAEEPEETRLAVIVGNVNVRGTKVYKTKEGKKLTVRVVKLLSPEKSELADAERARLANDSPLRTWTSKDGKHTIEARFLKFAGGKVHLVNGGGKTITVSPNDLSTEDREYYRSLVKKARDEAKRKAKPADEEVSQEY